MFLLKLRKSRCCKKMAAPTTVQRWTLIGTEDYGSEESSDFRPPAASTIDVNPRGLVLSSRPDLLPDQVIWNQYGSFDTAFIPFGCGPDIDDERFYAVITER
jgi:hypothetical protein